jgi:heme-degrading monooxygenase HmoA
MIVRVVTARVRRGREQQLHQLLLDQGPVMRAHDGLRYLKMARQVLPEGERVVIVEEWIDPESLYRWVGSDLTRARLMPGAEALLESVTVEHFEAIDLDPDQLPRS